MNKNVALVLSGGGARGIAHIGVIEVLEENGYQITSVAGTSMGAFVGAVYSTGKLTEFKNWLINIDKLEIVKLIDFSFSTLGFIKGDRLFTELKKFIPDTNIEDLPISFKAVATDIMNRREIVFEQGPIFDAVRASISIPSVFAPVKTDATMLVDGGMVNNLPIDRVERNEGDILVAVDVVANVPYYENVALEEEKHKGKIERFKNYFDDKKAKNISTKINNFEVLDKSINLMIEQLVKAKVKEYQPDIFIQVSQDASGLFDFFKAEHIVNIGRKIAQEQLDSFLTQNKSSEKIIKQNN